MNFPSLLARNVRQARLRELMQQIFAKRKILNSLPEISKQQPNSFESWISNHLLTTAITLSLFNCDYLSQTLKQKHIHFIFTTLGVCTDIQAEVQKETITKIHGQWTNQDLTILEKQLITGWQVERKFVVERQEDGLFVLLLISQNALPGGILLHPQCATNWQAAPF